MNKDEIREAYMQVSKELCNGTEWCWQGVEGPLERFAALIEQSVIKRLSAWAGEPWCASYDTVEARGGAFLFYTEEQVAAAVAAEREACAEVCYDVAHGYYLQHNPQMEQAADDCAAAIRGRTI